VEKNNVNQAVKGELKKTGRTNDARRSEKGDKTVPMQKKKDKEDRRPKRKPSDFRKRRVR